MTTPDFPDWAGGFAHQLHKLRSTAGPTLHQFEILFAPWIAHWRLSQQDEGKHSRKRRWHLRLVFWTFLWQVAQAGAAHGPGRTVETSPSSLRNSLIQPS